MSEHKNIIINIDSLLHQRIIDQVLKLYEDEHYPQAAAEAMKQVELAMKEKTGIKSKDNLFGVRLIQKVFGKNGKDCIITVPMAEDLQADAQSLFEGAFKYYRNYATHDGCKIDKTNCTRVMIIASELLDLIGASEFSLEQIGGVDGLVSKGFFKSQNELAEFLEFLSSQNFPFSIADGFFEEMAERGYSEMQYRTVFALGFLICKSEIRPHTIAGEPQQWDNYDWFVLTEVGHKLLSELKNE